jgi:dolichol kinase
MEKSFLVNQLVEFLFLHALAILEGLAVIYWNIKVNYTRKINHFFVFFFPVFLKQYLPYEENTMTLCLLPVTGLLSLCIYLPFIRKRVRLVQLMFAAFDRPEDRPYTLKWLFTQYAATYAIAAPLSIWFHHSGHAFILSILILINGIGDGLAEPIGVRFGKHTYQAMALFTNKRYKRSIEGSACVFISSVCILLYYADMFTTMQLVLALLLIPIIMTLAEAFSPHTWDSPFLFLCGGLVLGCICM